MSFLLLQPNELKGLVSMADAIDAIEKAYREAATYPLINAPRRRVHSPAGVRVSNFPGGVHGLGVIGSGTRADLVRQVATEQTYAYREHPVHVLHDSTTGHLLAILLGEIDDKDLGYTSLMALRTAATSGVGFRHLARQNVKTAGLFGSSGQAINQLLALKCERPITAVKVYSRNPENRRRFAKTWSKRFSLDITPVESPREVVQNVDVVLCATNTNVPLFDGSWLEPGQHVCGIIGLNASLVKGGWLTKRRRELDDRTVARADVIVVNLRESIVQDEQGDIFEPMEKGLVDLKDVRELGEVVAGTRTGRTGNAEITLHKNNNGLGIADLAIAMCAYERAKAAGRGTTIDLPAPGKQ